MQRRSEASGCSRAVVIATVLVACNGTPPRDRASADEPRAFVAPLLEGGEIDSSRSIGRRPLVLVFWSTWCDPCIAQLPHLVRFHSQYRDRVEIISVAVDDEHELPALRALVAKHGVSYPVAIDLDGAKILPRFSTSTGLPLILVIDAKGQVRFTQRNYAPGDERALGEAIEKVARMPRP